MVVKNQPLRSSRLSQQPEMIGAYLTVALESGDASPWQSVLSPAPRECDVADEAGRARQKRWDKKSFKEYCLEQLTLILL
jgi:hypothetical protein